MHYDLRLFEPGDVCQFQGRYYSVLQVMKRDYVIVDDEGNRLTVHHFTVS